MSMRWPGMLERQVIGRPVMGRITRPHEDATVWHVGAPGDQSLGDPRTDVMLPDTLRLCPGTSRLLPITDHRSPTTYPHHFPLTLQPAFPPSTWSTIRPMPEVVVLLSL